MLAGIRFGPLRCLLTSPLSRGLHSTPAVGEANKTGRANAGRGKRVAAAEGDSTAKVAETSVDENDDSAIQQGSLLTAEAINTADASEDGPPKNQKVTSRGY
ncbi:hypothetical protein GGF42_008659, partial [Coemansia sp. RSA 2424]